MAEEVDALARILGLPSLVSVCIHYYSLTYLYIDSNEELAALRHLFTWEHKRFIDWKSHAALGVSDNKPELGIDVAVEELTIACLENMSAAFQEVQTPSRVSKPLSRAAMGGPVATPLNYNPSRRKTVWAIQGPRNAEALCRQLKSYNDMLDVVWRRSRATVARSLLPELDGFDSIDGLRRIEDSLTWLHDGQYQDLAISARFRRLCLQHQPDERPPIAPTHWDDLRLLDQAQRMKHCNFPQEFFCGRLHRARLGDKDVLLEWKELPISLTMSTKFNGPDYEKLIDANIKELASILGAVSKPPDLKALSCVGSYQLQTIGSPKRVCFAFEPPSGSPAEPVSLQDLMEGHQLRRCGILRLGDKFVLAQGLASSVYQLLFAGWPHMGIRSSNVYFLKPLSGETAWRAEAKSFRLMGYQLTRSMDHIHGSFETELDIEPRRYLSPQYIERQQQGTFVHYKSHHDIYSLGIVLIEIALWQTARQLAQALGLHSAASLEAFQISAMEVLLPQVEERMGMVYADAVRFCLQGETEGPTDLPRLLKRFNRRVVSKLERCSA
ncbi:hypothetical protein B0T14DRAFT_568252 [Immersiella caudata]|uniref:DUF7580 domain-containing protein n=1 Tax=Immersiella caudata TaxID=314043 RepID=A0AA39WJS5_9PEZI|nr:hypothetical protein B0T14DRAFT_568252 [Immersiella caudata]